MKYGRVVLLVAVASLLALPARGQSRRLNGPLPRPGAADLLDDFALSRDGSRLVFRGDVFVDEAFELLSSPANASAPPVRLNGPLVAGGDVVRFVLGSQRAAYLADQDEDEVFELYSAPIAGGAALELSGTLVGGGDVTEFLLTPDGAGAVFLADALVDGQPELFRVPLDGSAAPIALDPSPSEDPVMDLRMAPDGVRILFTRREETTPFPQYPFYEVYVEHLFALALDGTQTKIEIAQTHPPSPIGLGVDGSFATIEFSHDGRRAVYTDQIDGKDGPEQIVLHSALVDGSAAPIVLSLSPSVSFLLSPSLARAIFYEARNLYSIALDGTARVQLDPPGVTALQPFALTPDGTSVVFQTGEITPRALLCARVDGSQPARVLDGPGSFTITEIVPTDTRVFYASRDVQSFAAFSGVYAVPLDGSASPLLLNGPAVERTGGNSLRPTPGGDLVLRNSYSTDTDLELYTVPQDGSLAPRRISGPMTSGHDVDRYLLAPDGNGVVYRADQTFDGTLELFRTSVSGGKLRNFLPLSPGPVVGDVLSYQVSPDGGSVVFLADQDTDEEFRLYRVPTSGKTGPTRVGRLTFFPGPFGDEYVFTPAGDRLVRFNTKAGTSLYSIGTAPGANEVRIGSGRVAGPLEFMPDGARLVFERSGFSSSDTQLVSAPLDGSGELTLFGITGRSVHDYELTPDGSAVVFVADASIQGKFELFRIPVAGGTPIPLTPQLASNRDVETFQITPDGSGVVYVANQRTPGQRELFVTRLDQSGPARRLSGALIDPGDVADFVFTPDGKRVVYRADAVVDGRLDLFSVPVEPSARGFQRVLGAGEPDAVQLTSGGRLVQPDYRVAADGTQVLYRTDVRTAVLEPPRYQLLRVPLLGGAAPAPLSQDGASVLSFELSPDKARIVYLADRGGVQELFSARTSGGEVVALDPLPAFADVSVYHVTPDSAVVYLCDRERDGELQLLRAPIDGSAPAAVLNDPLPLGGNVLADFVALPDGSVVYRADQESDDVFELFATGTVVGR